MSFEDILRYGKLVWEISWGWVIAVDQARIYHSQAYVSVGPGLTMQSNQGGIMYNRLGFGARTAGVFTNGARLVEDDEKQHSRTLWKTRLSGNLPQ